MGSVVVKFREGPDQVFPSVAKAIEDLRMVPDAWEISFYTENDEKVILRRQVQPLHPHTVEWVWVKEIPPLPKS